MSGETLLALAERVEAASEYDGRLMAEIDCAVRFPHLRPAEPNDHPSVKDRRFNPSDIWTQTGWLMARNYYRSVDDALSLVPDGHTVQLSDWDHELLRARGPWQAIILPIGARGAMQSFTFSNRCDHAATLALAVTAAALRARAHQETSNDG